MSASVAILPTVLQARAKQAHAPEATLEPAWVRVLLVGIALTTNIFN